MEEKFELLNKLREHMEDAELLEAIIMAMGTSQVIDILNYVGRCYDIIDS